MRGGHAVEFLIDRAHQHLPPETIDHAPGLALFLEPLLHGDALEIAAIALLPDRANGPRERQFFAERQKLQPQERSCKVRGRRQHATAEHTAASARFDERELTRERNILLDAQAAIKIEQVDAAAQQDMLAVVDELGLFAVADFIGSGTPAQEGPRFQQLNRVPRSA